MMSLSSAATRLILVIALLSSAGGQASAQSASGGAAEPVKAVISMDKGGWGNIFAEMPTALMRQYFSEGFNRSWAGAMAHNQQEPVLDGDPITGYQMLDKVTLRSVSASEHGEQATVTARVLASQEGGRPKPETIKFSMKREDGAWKVDDIMHSHQPSLRAYFRKSYGV